MRKSKVKQTWRDGGLALGTLIKSVDPVHSEAAGSIGFDFLWYDLEHADKSLETFANLARATRIGNVDILARPARWEYMRMGRLLEAGATGILYPRCESVEEAKEVVRWSKFQPLGERGFDGGNADNGFGQYPAENYIKEANEETWLAIQIESPTALPHVRAIADLEGVDCVFFGPGDFSALTGMPGKISSERVLAAAQQVAEATLAAGKVFGSISFSMEHTKRLLDMGAKLISHGADIVDYKQAMSRILEQYRSE